MHRLNTLKRMYLMQIEYNNTILSMLDTLTPEESEELKREYGYDMNENFSREKLEYKIREATDRMYFLNSMQICEHVIMTDHIDIDVDKSMTIKYCERCNKTFS